MAPDVLLCETETFADDVAVFDACTVLFDVLVVVDLGKFVTIICAFSLPLGLPVSVTMIVASNFDCRPLVFVCERGNATF
jgi:hypothetical protein